MSKYYVVYAETMERHPQYRYTGKDDTFSDYEKEWQSYETPAQAVEARAVLVRILQNTETKLAVVRENNAKDDSTFFVRVA